MKWIGLSVLVIGGIVLGGIARLRSSTAIDGIGEEAPHIQASEFSLAAVGPIYTEGDAISRSLAFFPGHLTPDDAVGRLLTYKAYLNIGAPMPTAYSGTQFARPVWVVAITPISSEQAQTSGLGFESPDEASDVAGFYYQWNAGSGELEQFGGLDPGPDWMSFATISSLSSMSIPITPVAPRPTLSLDPGPLPPGTPAP